MQFIQPEMQKISEFNPAELWFYFEKILAIPRISKKEEKIIAYLEAFAKDHKLECRTDRVGNVLITKPATRGLENRKGVILQSHLDMVGEKNAHVKHDFLKDPIIPIIENGWVKATETTLGADDGIGIAASLAILASDTIAHGPLECLFTSDEESGMTGALGLQPGFLKGEILLNLDSEDEGEIFIGCAGGRDTVGVLQLKRKRCKRTRKALKVSIGGLNGGHSGDDIHKGLGNSIKILTRYLWNAGQRMNIHLASLEGGKARNAIPREASAVICIPAKELELIRVFFSSFEEIIKKELELTEPGLVMTLEEVGLPDTVIRKKQQKRVLNALNVIPHGVIEMSREIPSLVETSTNLASIRMLGEEQLEIVTSQRSSVESAKRDISDRIASLFHLLRAQPKHSDGYPGWKPDVNSEILGISELVYEDLFKEKAEVKAIHAGLECGLFLQKYPDLDMISFGPTIKGAHTPEERIQVESVKKFWDFLLLLLERTPEKSA